MSYNAITFTPFDPLPASDMNILAANDASFHDGTGIDTAVITTAKIANNAITSAKLAPALTNSTPGSLSNITSTPSTGATLSLTAGTYLVIAKATCSISSTLRVIYTAEIYNSTDSASIDILTAEAEFTSGTINADIPTTNASLLTIAGTKSIIARYSVSDPVGTADVTNIKLIAVPVGV